MGRFAAASMLVLLAAILVAAPSSRHSAGAGRIFRDCSDCPALRIVPAGSFVMGSPDAEPGRQAAEGPQHRVTIARPFALAVHDVTRAEFARFVAETGYRTDTSRCDWRDPRSRGQRLDQAPDHPVVCVSQDDAHAYVNWLSRKSGKPYRLPSEAEWEYAARAGSATIRPWGDGISRDFANYGADSCCAPFAAGRDRWVYTSPVGAFPPNRFGLFDMLGNVWQRTEDCGHDDYAAAPADGSAWISGGDCTRRMVRGGAWFHPPELVRSAARAADPADFRHADIGFRVARSL